MNNVETNLLPGYENQIIDLNKLIDTLEKPKMFRVYAMFSGGIAEYTHYSVKGSIGTVFKNKFMFGLSAGYPSSVELDVGWIF